MFAPHDVRYSFRHTMFAPHFVSLPQWGKGDRVAVDEVGYELCLHRAMLGICFTIPQSAAPTAPFAQGSLGKSQKITYRREECKVFIFRREQAPALRC